MILDATWTSRFWIRVEAAGLVFDQRKLSRGRRRFCDNYFDILTNIHIDVDLLPRKTQRVSYYVASHAKPRTEKSCEDTIRLLNFPNFKHQRQHIR